MPRCSAQTDRLILSRRVAVGAVAQTQRESVSPREAAPWGWKPSAVSVFCSASSVERPDGRCELPADLPARGLDVS